MNLVPEQRTTGPIRPCPHEMSYSLNETEALCRKATRGAGYSWGEADEAGRAARWLHMQGLPGAASLANALETPGAEVALDETGGISGAGPLCAIKAGIALADHLHLITTTTSLRLTAVNEPLLLLGFAGCASFTAPEAIEVVTEQAKAVVFRDAMALSQGFGPSSPITLTLAQAPLDLLDRRSRAMIPDDIYTRLNSFAQRTYAPATAASRIAGAGAGLSDND